VRGWTTKRAEGDVIVGNLAVFVDRAKCHGRTEFAGKDARPQKPQPGSRIAYLTAVQNLVRASGGLALVLPR
jgi:hypothetical protein